MDTGTRMDIERIRSSYEKLRLQDANEAETRHKLIDEVLRLIGWTHDDYTVEERIAEDGKAHYADYIVRTANTGFVIEAKRIGESLLEVPSTRRCGLHGQIMTGATGDAILQARGYARSQSIPFAVVTNGVVWIIFPGSRSDMVPGAKSTAICFPSIQSVLKHDFTEFVALLSRESVISGSLETELLGRADDQIDTRRLNSVFDRPFYTVRRNSVYPLIENAVIAAFTDQIIDQDDELLEKCYVNSPNKLKFDNKIRMHIVSQQPDVSQEMLRPRQNKDRRALDEVISSAHAKAQSVAVLILGRVGAGKTTFLKYTRRVSAKALFDPNQPKAAQWVQINFLECPSGISAVDYIYERALEHISVDPFLQDSKKCVLPAYRAEIQGLTRGPLSLLGDEAERNRKITEIILADYASKKPYVDKILSYVAKNVPVFLVVDNIDQIESIDDQSKIFVDAMAIAQRNRLNLIIAMRDTTYVQRKNMATFDAYEFDTMYIDPPNIQAVISQRFFLAREMLRNQVGTFVAENGARVVVEDKSIIVQLVQSSVLGTEVGELIEVLATGDVRLALRMTREFLQSGYTATGKALQIYRKTGNYRLPLHEAIRSIMLGNKKIYSEQFSVIANPFDARLARTQAQMLRLYLLSAIVSMGSKGEFRHLDGEEVLRAFRTIGFGDNATEKVLKDLCEHRFIETSSRGEASLSASYIPTRLGGYVVRSLIGTLVFLENVMMDTFISSIDVWKRLKGMSQQIYDERQPTTRLALRKQRINVFYDYVSSLYDPLQAESIRRGLNADWCQHPLKDMRSVLNEGLTRAMRSSINIYGRGAAEAAMDDEARATD